MSEYQGKLDETFGKPGSMEDALKQGIQEGATPGPGVVQTPEPQATEGQSVENVEVTQEEVTTQEPTAEEVENQALAEDDVEEPKPTKPHRDLKAEARIAKLVKEREQLKGHLRALQEQTNRQANPQQQQATPTANALPHQIDPEAPNPANYPEGDKDIDYRVDVKFYAQNIQHKMVAFEKQKQEAIKKYSDLPELLAMDEERVQSGIPTANPTVVSLLTKSDIAGDLWHHLLSNPEEATRIARMDPVSTAREIGKLEAKLSMPEPPPAPVAPKKALPAPITPVKTTKTNTVTGNKNFGFTEY